MDLISDICFMFTVDVQASTDVGLVPILAVLTNGLPGDPTSKVYFHEGLRSLL